MSDQGKLILALLFLIFIYLMCFYCWFDSYDHSYSKYIPALATPAGTQDNYGQQEDKEKDLQYQFFCEENYKL